MDPKDKYTRSAKDVRNLWVIPSSSDKLTDKNPKILAKERIARRGDAKYNTFKDYSSLVGYLRKLELNSFVTV